MGSEMMTRSSVRSLCLAILIAMVRLAGASPAFAAEPPQAVVIITVDALRADRLSAYGYQRKTSPNIDQLLASGTRFTRAWTVEPLTYPAVTSMLTSLPPHQHGATRNGLRMLPGLTSLPKLLQARGWRTAAFVCNWTLKPKLSRLDAHFEHYEGVFTRRRWFGLVNREANAADVTDQALEWLGDCCKRRSEQKLLLWVHYVEPHAPYRFHGEYAAELGIRRSEATRSDNYDTEIRAVDHEVGRLLEGVLDKIPAERVIVVFTADHGESLGEHQYWGHGRHLYEPSLHIPLGIVWRGRIQPGVMTEPVLNIDVAPTILELLELPVPESFKGDSWAQALVGRAPLQPRVLCFQAHKGAVKIHHESQRARTNGLLEVGIVNAEHKEILLLRKNRLQLFNLESDPRELSNLATNGQGRSIELMGCVGLVMDGLGALDHLAVPNLDEESLEQLRSLGYIQ
jgi:arylsulfatase A-like enzyme